ncbi:MAG: DUF4340 domain-containing protein, partial [Acidobacteria bacterium]
MRGLKSLGILVAVMAGLGAYIYFVESKKPSEADAEARPKVFDVAAEKIVELTVRSEENRTVLRKSDGRWQVVEPVVTAADETEVSSITSSIASLENVRVVEETPSNLAEFGLAEPRVEIGFRLDGEKDMRHLRVGDKTATQGEVYASRGGKQVFLIPSYVESSFAKTTFELRDKSILTFPRDKVDRLVVQGEGASKSVAKAGSEWKLTEPVSAPADYGTVEGLIGQLETARMTAITALEAGDLKPYGLNEPAVSVTLGTGSSQATLLVGNKADDAGYYAKDASRTLVFTIENRLVDELKKPAGDLRNKDVFAFRPFNASALDVAKGTDVLAFAKSKEGTGENATEKWRRLKPTPAEADQVKVDDVLSKLSNLRVEEFNDQPEVLKAFQAPVLEVLVKFDEARKQEKVTFGRSGSDVYASI